MRYYENMKRFLCVFVILLFCAASCVAFLACDAESERALPVTLREGMRAEEIFDLLERAFSYTIIIGEEDYRFVRGKGYTKLEEGVFDGLLEEGGQVFRMSTKDGAKVQQEPLNENFYREVDKVYEDYIKLLKESFENMTSRDPVEFSLGAGGYKATIKIIMRKSQGEFSVITCEISNVNSTVLFFPDELKDYKQLAENT